MTKEEKTELLKIDICARLTYGLRGVDNATKHTPVLETMNSYGDLKWTYDTYLPYEELVDGDDVDVIPILRPMSDLYAEITHAGYNDGKPFIPIVECARKFKPKEDWVFKKVGPYDYAAVDSEERQFGYRSGKFLTCMGEECICNQWEQFDLLNRLMIDYRGLIPAGLAKSVHDLDKNPYE